MWRIYSRLSNTALESTRNCGAISCCSSQSIHTASILLVGTRWPTHSITPPLPTTNVTARWPSNNTATHVVPPVPVRAASNAVSIAAELAAIAAKANVPRSATTTFNPATGVTGEFRQPKTQPLRVKDLGREIFEPLHPCITRPLHGTLEQALRQIGIPQIQSLSQPALQYLLTTIYLLEKHPEELKMTHAISINENELDPMEYTPTMPADDSVPIGSVAVRIQGRRDVYTLTERLSRHYIRRDERECLSWSSLGDKLSIGPNDLFTQWMKKQISHINEVFKKHKSIDANLACSMESMHEVQQAVKLLFNLSESLRYSGLCDLLAFTSDPNEIGPAALNFLSADSRFKPRNAKADTKARYIDMRFGRLEISMDPTRPDREMLRQTRQAIHQPIIIREITDLMQRNIDLMVCPFMAPKIEKVDTTVGVSATTTTPSTSTVSTVSSSAVSNPTVDSSDSRDHERSDEGVGDENDSTPSLIKKKEWAEYDDYSKIPIPVEETFDASYKPKEFPSRALHHNIIRLASFVHSIRHLHSGGRFLHTLAHMLCLDPTALHEVRAQRDNRSHSLMEQKRAESDCRTYPKSLGDEFPFRFWHPNLFPELSADGSNPGPRPMYAEDLLLWQLSLNDFIHFFQLLVVYKELMHKGSRVLRLMQSWMNQHVQHICAQASLTQLTSIMECHAQLDITEHEALYLFMQTAMDRAAEVRDREMKLRAKIQHAIDHFTSQPSFSDPSPTMIHASGHPTLFSCINSTCPWSGKPVSVDSLTRYLGRTVGFCNPACRDQFDEAMRTKRLMNSVRSYPAPVKILVLPYRDSFPRSDDKSIELLRSMFIAFARTAEPRKSKQPKRWFWFAWTTENPLPMHLALPRLAQILTAHYGQLCDSGSFQLSPGPAIDPELIQMVSFVWSLIAVEMEKFPWCVQFMSKFIRWFEGQHRIVMKEQQEGATRRETSLQRPDPLTGQLVEVTNYKTIIFKLQQISLALFLRGQYFSSPIPESPTPPLVDPLQLPSFNGRYENLQYFDVNFSSDFREYFRTGANRPKVHVSSFQLFVYDMLRDPTGPFAFRQRLQHNHFVLRDHPDLDLTHATADHLARVEGESVLRALYDSGVSPTESSIDRRDHHTVDFFVEHNTSVGYVLDAALFDYRVVREPKTPRPSSLLSLPAVAAIVQAPPSVRLESTPIAIEIDGPRHFRRSNGGIYDCVTRLRKKQLHLCGWRIISISHAEWNRRNSREEKVSWIASMLPPRLLKQARQERRAAIQDKRNWLLSVGTANALRFKFHGKSRSPSSVSSVSDGSVHGSSGSTRSNHRKPRPTVIDVPVLSSDLSAWAQSLRLKLPLNKVKTVEHGATNDDNQDTRLHDASGDEMERDWIMQDGSDNQR